MIIDGVEYYMVMDSTGIYMGGYYVGVVAL